MCYENNLTTSSWEVMHKNPANKQIKYGNLFLLEKWDVWKAASNGFVTKVDTTHIVQAD